MIWEKYSWQPDWKERASIAQKQNNFLHCSCKSSFSFYWSKVYVKYCISVRCTTGSTWSAPDLQNKPKKHHSFIPQNISISYEAALYRASVKDRLNLEELADETNDDHSTESLKCRGECECLMLTGRAGHHPPWGSTEASPRTWVLASLKVNQFRNPEHNT